MVMVKEETRKGPWTEQEDLQLVCFVRLFGERRWDFIAKVSGLNRTGKSCRLRWVNYLHPGLKRGRLTPHEERLILELHSRWGNRWSRIARRLPGRTDNEIKNYWRTHMRKKAQEKKRNNNNNKNDDNGNGNGNDKLSPSSPSSSITYQSSLNEKPPPKACTGVEKLEPNSLSGCSRIDDDDDDDDDHDGMHGCYPMEQIWKEIEASEAVRDDACNISCHPMMMPPPTPLWDYNSIWSINDDVDDDDDESKNKLFSSPLGEVLGSNCCHSRE